MFSLDNTCPSCGRIGFESLSLAKIQAAEVTVSVYCGYCFFRPPNIRLCARVSLALLSAAFLEADETLESICPFILSLSSTTPTTGPLASAVNDCLRSLFNREEDGDTVSHRFLDATVFGKLIWFAGMYGYRFLTLGQLHDLLLRSVGSVGNGTHVSGESL